MAVPATTLDDELVDLLQTVFDETTAPLVVVNPTPDMLEGLIIAAVEHETELPELRVLADDRTLKTMAEDFIIASQAADLIADGTLSLRITELSRNSMLVTPDQVIVLISINEEIRGMESDDSELVETAHETFMDAWENAEEFSLRTPPYSQVLDTLDDEIGTETKEDFVAVIDSVETVRGNGDDLDEVEISLLVAARNEVLLYDISKWGEDVGLASKATFSRSKTALEDRGLIDTEKVPIDVGRPRLRLRLATEDLQTADVDELVDRARAQVQA